MSFANGRAPQDELGRITIAADGRQAYLRKDAARAFMAMNAESERRFGVTLRATSFRTGYRSLADQQYFWNLYQSGRGNLAARPGTSNHGYGLAVDFATPGMRQIVDQIGAKYGFAKRWSDAPSEWWHVCYKPGNYAAVNSYHADDLPVLKPGATHKQVKYLKKLLRDQGVKSAGKHPATHFPSLDNGKKYGSHAVQRVKIFQRKMGMKDDGIVGPKTWRALKNKAN